MDTIAAFLDDLEERGLSSTTRRIRARFLAEYLEHALNSADTARTDMPVEEFMEPDRAEAWLAAALDGKTRQRNTLSGPEAESSDATDRVRRVTYNLFAEFAGVPHRLHVPPNRRSSRLSSNQARSLVHEAAVKRPPSVDTAAWIRSAALAALVAASDRPVSELAVLTVDDVQLDRRPPRVVLADGPVLLDAEAAQVLGRWLRQRAGITAALQGSDPGHLWIPVKPGRPRNGVEPAPPGTKPAAVRTLLSSHRRMVLELLGRPTPPRALRSPAS